MEGFLSHHIAKQKSQFNIILYYYYYMYNIKKEIFFSHGGKIEGKRAGSVFEPRLNKYGDLIG